MYKDLLNARKHTGQHLCVQSYGPHGYKVGKAVTKGCEVLRSLQRKIIKKINESQSPNHQY